MKIIATITLSNDQKDTGELFVDGDQVRARNARTGEIEEGSHTIPPGMKPEEAITIWYGSGEVWNLKFSE